MAMAEVTLRYEGRTEAPVGEDPGAEKIWTVVIDGEPSTFFSLSCSITIDVTNQPRYYWAVVTELGTDDEDLLSYWSQSDDVPIIKKVTDALAFHGYLKEVEHF